MAQITRTPDQLCGLVKSQHHVIETRLEKSGPGAAAFDDALAELVSSLRAHELAEKAEELPAIATHSSPEDLARAYSASSRSPGSPASRAGPSRKAPT